MLKKTKFCWTLDGGCKRSKLFKMESHSYIFNDLVYIIEKIERINLLLVREIF